MQLCILCAEESFDESHQVNVEKQARQLEIYQICLDLLDDIFDIRNKLKSSLPIGLQNETQEVDTLKKNVLDIACRSKVEKFHELLVEWLVSRNYLAELFEVTKLFSFYP